MVNVEAPDKVNKLLADFTELIRPLCYIIEKIWYARSITFKKDTSYE